MFNVPLLIPHAYKAGWSKIYRLHIGPRGGKSWRVTNTITSFGVYLPDAAFEAGEWKVTQWVNGWPRVIDHFSLDEHGLYTDLMED